MADERAIRYTSLAAGSIEQSQCVGFRWSPPPVSSMRRLLPSVPLLSLPQFTAIYLQFQGSKKIPCA